VSHQNDPENVVSRLRRLIFGRPRDLEDRSLAHKIALIPLLAWIGLGADGLSSSAYGPEECLRAVGEHTYLAIPLAGMMAFTVFVISTCYTRIIERFPQGGGGYVVTTALLGRRTGVVAGCALLIDYVLTISVSIAAANAALFSFLPSGWHDGKLFVDAALIVMMVLLNIRGVRESVLVLAPIFVVFAVTHLGVILGGILWHVPELPETARRCADGFREGLGVLGLAGLARLFVHAYSLGGGTYTGIEAVSNGLSIMREPRVATAKRTMLYMSCSLAFTAGGLLVCYLLWEVRPEPGRTLNAALISKMVADLPFGSWLVVITLCSESAILLVAAQAGFIDGPRVLANMALDGWVPRSFASLSERLTGQNGVILMGAAALATLVYAGGDLHKLIVMYSINVFITFSLSTFGMSRDAIRPQPNGRARIRRVTLFVVGFALCVTVLGITTAEKFAEGGWLTLLITGATVGLCLLVRRHYDGVESHLRRLTQELSGPLSTPPGEVPAIMPTEPTAAILVSGYGGLGLHTMLTVFRAFSGHFKNLVFLGVGVVDSGEFKGQFAIDALKQRTEETLRKYVSAAHSLGLAAVYRMEIGTDVVDEAAALCEKVAIEFPRTTFFAGKVIFKHENWFERLLHNQTAFAIQRRLHWNGRVMVVLPVRLD